MIIDKVIRNIEAIIPWRRGLAQESHPCFIGSTSALVPVAGNTGTDHIVPGMFPTPPPWNNVVQGKLPGLLTTILADVMVAIKYLEPA